MNVSTNIGIVNILRTWIIVWWTGCLSSTSISTNMEYKNNKEYNRHNCNSNNGYKGTDAFIIQYLVYLTHLTRWVPSWSRKILNKKISTLLLFLTKTIHAMHYLLCDAVVWIIYHITLCFSRKQPRQNICYNPRCKVLFLFSIVLVISLDCCSLIFS